MPSAAEPGWAFARSGAMMPTPSAYSFTGLPVEGLSTTRLFIPSCRGSDRALPYGRWYCPTQNPR